MCENIDKKNWFKYVKRFFLSNHSLVWLKQFYNSWCILGQSSSQKSSATLSRSVSCQTESFDDECPINDIALR